MTGPDGNRRSLWLLPVVALVVACVGIEGTGSPQAGIEGTGYSEGNASGFGSVFVNGVRYDTGHAEILFNDRNGSENELQVGMVLRVHGRVDAGGATGSAGRIEFTPTAAGPVEAVERDAGRLAVLGQTVLIDDDTVFPGMALDALAAGDACVISGYRNSAGEILASYLDCTGGYAPGTTVSVEGIATALDADSFQIGDLAVDYRGASIDRTLGDLTEGTSVAVSGVQTQLRGVMSASHLRVRPQVRAAAGDNAQIEGLITRFANLEDFEVGGQRVNAAGARRTDDSTLQPALDARIEVTGTMDAAGILQAARYAIKPAGAIVYQGQLDAVDASGGRLDLLGIPMSVEPDTQYQDNSASAQRHFRIGALAAGDYVEVRAWRTRSGDARLNRVERRNPEGADPGVLDATVPVPVPTPVSMIGMPAADLMTAVRGPVDDFDVLTGVMVVAGVTVRTNMALTTFDDDSAVPQPGVTFFAGLREGDVVRVEGTESNDEIEAQHVERE